MGTRITTPPTKDDLRVWVIEKYGGDFEPTYLNSLIDEFINDIGKHKEYSKKRSLKYFSENYFKLDRIYRKQEKLYWIKRGWSEIDAEKKRVVRNKSWYIKTYGEVDGIKKYEMKCKNISNNCGHSLEKFINRYGEKIGKDKWVEYKRGCVRDLNHFIIKYGDIDGYNKYKEFKGHIGLASKESLKVFKPLIEWVTKMIPMNEIYVGIPKSREFFISENGKQYLYDFTIKKLKIIVEFNGVKFHVNENWSKERINNWVHPFKRFSVDEQIEYDKMKLSLAKNHGFDVLTIWSDTSVEENIKICKEFILTKLNNNE